MEPEHGWRPPSELWQSLLSAPSPCYTGDDAVSHWLHLGRVGHKYPRIRFFFPPANVCLKSGALLTNMCLLCLVDFGMIENSLLSFIAIFLPAISSYMADKYSSGRSLLSLIPRFILMYCSFVILFFTYINRKQGRNLVEHIFNCGYKMCFLSIEKTGTKW